MLVNNWFLVRIFKIMYTMIKRKTKYENVMNTICENEKITDATSKSLSCSKQDTL